MQSLFTPSLFVGIPYQQLDGGDRKVSFLLVADTLNISAVEEGENCTSPETVKEGLIRFFKIHSKLHVNVGIEKGEKICSETLFRLFTLFKYLEKQGHEILVQWTYDREDMENGFLIEDIQEVFDIPVCVVPS
jgi:hypothetical protein